MSEAPKQPHSPYFLDWAWANKLLVLPIVLALMFSLCGGCFGLAYISSLQSLRKNPLHMKSVEAARENEQVVKELGLPIEGGFISEGKIEVDDEMQQGYADCTIPISGPIGTAKLFVKAKLEAGTWIINSLQASLENSGQIVTIIDPDAVPEEKPEAVE